MGGKAPHRGIDAVTIGDTSPPRRLTITAAQVAQFAGLTGDREPIHIDETYARQTPYGRCIAHGVHLLGLMSAKLLNTDQGAQPNVSYGYDRIRFVRPAFVGQTVTIHATVIDKRDDKNEVVVEERCVNDHGELVAIATHIYKFV